jgi:hypothetical protein
MCLHPGHDLRRFPFCFHAQRDVRVVGEVTSPAGYDREAGRDCICAMAAKRPEQYEEIKNQKPPRVIYYDCLAGGAESNRNTFFSLKLIDLQL